MVRIAWLMLLVIAGSSTAEPTGKPATNVSAWTREEVAGYDLKLIDDKRVCNLSFHEKGHVAATLGPRGGVIFGPLLFWRIDRDGVLVISEEEGGTGRVFFRFKMIKLGKDRVEVDHDGVKETFSRAKR